MMIKKLTIVIPAYNEADNLEQLFPRFHKAVQDLRAKQIDAEMVVVNDGSSDATAAKSRENHVTVVSHPFNLGVCAALHTGFLYALENDSDALITVDADGQHNPEDIHYLIREFEKRNSDVIIGSRFVEKTGYKKEFLRFSGIKLFSVLVKLLTHLTIHDVTSGFRVFDKKAIRFLSNHFPEDYPDAEILILLNKSGFKVEEVPIEMNPRMQGTSQHNLKSALLYPFKNLLTILIVLIRTLQKKRANT
ncbi:MAG: glycosyltransferase family 2 protein [candidate division KSB1 bacterium]|nr:glycosyltransferase family 2 protein [candidate division KSB1 bacterium]